MKDLFARLERWLNGLSPRRAYILAIGCALIIGGTDLCATEGLSFSLGYVLVIGFAGWSAGAIPAALLALIPAAVTAWEDWQVFGNGALPTMVWNVFSRTVLYVLVSWVCAALSRANHRYRSAAEERTAAWQAEAAKHQATTAQLRETVERFEQVINNITEVFWLTNPEKTEMIYISPGYERIWGRSCEALRAKPESWLDALHPEDRAEITRRSKTEQTSSAYDVEYRIIRPDGAERWIRDRAFPVRNAAGEIYRVAGIAEDVTEHKTIAKALAEANELTQAILQASPAGIAAWKASGHCVMANAAMARILGGTSEAILKQNFRELASWKEHGMLEQADLVLRTKNPIATDYHGFSSFGRELFLRFQMAYCTVQGEPHVLIVLNDVSDRMRLERQILEITDREQARIGQDIHDGLCQELVGIAFDASQLQSALESRGIPEASRAKRMATELDNAITKARQVARGLFPIRMEGEGVISALEELLNSVHARWDFHCNLELSGDLQIPPGAITTHLYRIAHEAVNNAVKHSGGTKILIRLATENGSVQLNIEDDGKGFAPTLGYDGPTGMGLSIMEYRARTIGASLEVKARAGGGTVVSCSL